MCFPASVTTQTSSNVAVQPFMWLHVRMKSHSAAVVLLLLMETQRASMRCGRSDKSQWFFWFQLWIKHNNKRRTIKHSLLSAFAASRNSQPAELDRSLDAWLCRFTEPVTDQIISRIQLICVHTCNWGSRGLLEDWKPELLLCKTQTVWQTILLWLRWTCLYCDCFNQFCSFF